MTDDRSLALAVAALAQSCASRRTTRPQPPAASSSPAQHGRRRVRRRATPATTQTVPGDHGRSCCPTATPRRRRSRPQQVKQAIWAANEIVGKPYVYGGGHNPTFRSRGYDCSGTVSYALHGGDLLDAPLDSGRFMKWGAAGTGQWITVYTNPGHAYVVIAGLRLDTSAAGDRRGAKGPRWRPALRKTRGFRARHPDGSVGARPRRLIRGTSARPVGSTAS